MGFVEAQLIDIFPQQCAHKGFVFGDNGYRDVVVFVEEFENFGNVCVGPNFDRRIHHAGRDGSVGSREKKLTQRNHTCECARLVHGIYVLDRVVCILFYICAHFVDDVLH